MDSPSADDPLLRLLRRMEALGGPLRLELVGEGLIEQTPEQVYKRIRTTIVTTDGTNTLLMPNGDKAVLRPNDDEAGVACLFNELDWDRAEIVIAEVDRGPE